MTVTAEQFRQPAQAIVDRHCAYGFCDRCGGSCIPEQYDCSGMQCKCANVTHLLPYQICTTSFVMAQMCWDAGLYMPVDVAEADSGPDVFWAFHGANYGRTDDGSRPNGASGHIVLVVRVRNPDGTTKGFYTCEAMGHAYGCVNGAYYGRGWTGRYRIPGVQDRPPAPTEEYDEMIIKAPASQQHDVNRPACAYLDIPAKEVRLLNGASVHQSTTIPSSTPILGWLREPDGSGFTVIARRAPGHTDNPAYRFTWDPK